MIPLTDDLNLRLGQKKLEWRRGKYTTPRKGILVYCCANCKHRGQTLKKSGKLRVCYDAAACKIQRGKLTDAERDALDEMRRAIV